VVGGLSDWFEPVGADTASSGEALAAAMAVTALGYLWAALHFFRATRDIRRELALTL
jgi:hypothetical protein